MIFNDVFCATFSQSFFIFLCGGAGRKHIRNKIRVLLEESGLQVFYPEDLFMDMLNRDKKSDLLEYENLLADNSDRVCIICESMGSAVELGAFIQNENLEKKLIVCINQKFARDKSFIMMGPVKHLKKINKSLILLYKENEAELLGKELIKRFHRLQRFSKKGNKLQSFNNLSAYIALIPMIVYFFGSVKRREMYKTLKELLFKQQKIPSSYNQLFNAAVKYLVRSSAIITRFDNLENDELLSLSHKGYIETLNLLNLSWAKNKTILQDKIRCAILKEQLNN